MDEDHDLMTTIHGTESHVICYFIKLHASFMIFLGCDAHEGLFQGYGPVLGAEEEDAIVGAAEELADVFVVR